MPHYDPFGNFDSFGYEHCLVLNPEYAERLVYTSGQYQVAVEFSGTPLLAYGQLNQETGEFTFDSFSTNLMPHDRMGIIEDWELCMYHLSPYYHPGQSDDTIPPNPPYGESGYVEDGYYEIFGYLENPGIGRIQGSLLFYDYPVHKQ